MKTKRKLIRIQGFSNFRFLVPAYLILFTVACTVTKSTTYKEPVSDHPFTELVFSAGVVTGGIVENVEMSGIDDISDTDAISGATRLSFNAGIHTEISSGKHHMETGIDYVRFKQTLTYLISGDGIDGTRSIRFQQVRLPLTVNFHFIKNSVNDPELILKAGMSAGYTLKTTVTESGTLPQSSFNKWDFGPTLGITFYPLQHKGKNRIGFYLDLYRGSRIYDDIYHKAEGMGGQSILKAGVTCQF